MGRNRRGGILLITLVILAVCLAILATTAANQDIRTRTSINRIELMRARIAAESGVRRAAAALVTQDPNLVTLDGDWYLLGNEASDAFQLLSGDSFRVQVLDASSFISLNTAPEEELLNLGLTTEQVESLLDWREPGQTARAEGAKDDYYNNLDTPYNAKLGRLDSIDELLLIKGFDAATVYEALDQSGTTIRTDETFSLYQMVTTDAFSPNLNPDGEAKTNLNSAQANQLQQSGIQPQVAQAIIARRNGLGGQFSTLGEALSTPGMDNNSARILIDGYGIVEGDRVEGKVNLNTATQSVLEAIPGITPDLSSGILSRQTSGGFTTVGELLDIGFDLSVLAQNVDAFTVSSDTFIVRVIGTAGQTSVALEATIRIEGGQPVVRKITEAPLRDMRALWNWEEEATNEVEING